MQMVECRRSVWGCGNGWNAELGNFSGAELLKAFELFARSVSLKKISMPGVRLVRDIDGIQSHTAVMRFPKDNSRDSAPADIGLFVGLDGMSSLVKKSERYEPGKVYLGNLLSDPETRSDTRLLSHEEVIVWVTQVRDEFVKFLKENRAKWQQSEDQRETSIIHHSV